jgi:ABC-2 type transport system ATP-binding protein
MPDIVIEAAGLRRSFGDLAAVDGIDLRVERGQFYGFLGPNGAGKSTTIKMLTGMLRPTAGSVRILGFDLQREPVEVKKRIGVVPEGLALFERLTGTQLLNFIGRMYGLSRETAAERGSELLDFMELRDASNQMVTDYSHGMKKKIALAAAVIHRPEILFLDEPFEGVDAVAASTLKGLLQRFLARGGTVFLTSHVLEVVERLCTHIGIIRQGRMVVSASLEDLRAGVQVAEAGSEALTLEQIFLHVVGGSRSHEGELSWF